jgi:hypothetical protein
VLLRKPKLSMWQLFLYQGCLRRIGKKTVPPIPTKNNHHEEKKCKAEGLGLM